MTDSRSPEVLAEYQRLFDEWQTRVQKYRDVHANAGDRPTSEEQPNYVDTPIDKLRKARDEAWKQLRDFELLHNLRQEMLG